MTNLQFVCLLFRIFYLWNLDYNEFLVHVCFFTDYFPKTLNLFLSKISDFIEIKWISDAYNLRTVVIIFCMEMLIKTFFSPSARIDFSPVFELYLKHAFLGQLAIAFPEKVMGSPRNPKNMSLYLNCALSHCEEDEQLLGHVSCQQQESLGFSLFPTDLLYLIHSEGLWRRQ